MGTQVETLDLIRNLPEQFEAALLKPTEEIPEAIAELRHRMSAACRELLRLEDHLTACPHEALNIRAALMEKRMVREVQAVVAGQN